MSNIADFDPDRREALSNLLRYAEHEARQLNETGLADKIRSAYLSMDCGSVAPQSDILLMVNHKSKR